MERTLAQHASPSLSRHGPGFIRTPLIPALFRSAVPQSAAATLGTAAASASPKLRKAQLPSVCALKASSKASSVCVRRIVCAQHMRMHTRTRTHHLGSSKRRTSKKPESTHAHTHTRTLTLTHTLTHTHTASLCGEAGGRGEEVRRKRHDKVKRREYRDICHSRRHSRRHPPKGP